MKIPISTILDLLSPYNIEDHSKSFEKVFSSVNIFPSRKKELYPYQLYVGKLSDILAAEWRSADTYCIAVRDRIHDEAETDDNMTNIIVLNANCDVSDIFTTVQGHFFRIMEWNEQMKEYLIQNRSVQDLLLLSEPIIGNYITISDSSLRLLAHTSGLECDCPITNSLVAKGYHDDTAVATFKKYRVTEQWNTANDIYINNSLLVSPYPNVCRVVRYNNSYFAHVIMICNTHKPTDGLIDLFKMLLSHLMVAFERLWNNSEGSALHVYDSLIISLIEDKGLTNDIISERARHCGLPQNAVFRLLKASIADNVAVMLQRMGQDIMSMIPEAKVTVYNKDLIILLTQKPDAADCFARHEITLESIMDSYNAKCGVSNVFLSLSEIPLAYQQADVALRHGGFQSSNLFSCQTNHTSSRLYPYENYYYCYLMCGTAEHSRLARSTKAYNALKKLLQYDTQHGTNNLELLYVYLNNDRKATDTAAVMHMHRNNVIYRIGRICDLIEMDLDDSRVRFRLLLAYEIFSPIEQ